MPHTTPATDGHGSLIGYLAAAVAVIAILMVCVTEPPPLNGTGCYEPQTLHHQPLH